MEDLIHMQEYLKAQDEVNIDEICRLCRTSRGIMSYIFSCSGVDTSAPLSERIMDFANIKMTEGDGLPSLICHQCLYLIEKANEFKMLCEQSDAVLRQYLTYQIDAKEHHIPQKLENRINGFSCETDISRTSDGSEDQQCESEDGELNCPTCNKHFETFAQLDRHKLIHTQEGPFPCDYCEVVEKDKASLRSHWRQGHAPRYSQVCQTCGEFFASKDILLNHNLRHDKAKPHHCSICKKAFSYRSDLRKHLVIHSGLRPYHCPVCFKSFTRSTNLNKHARLHSGNKPFSCVSCGKVFASRSDLLRHSVIHTGEKPYICNICSISFTRKDKLTRHERLHVGDRAHSCPECPTSFTRKEELTKHMQFHHYSPEMIDDDTEESEEGEETEDVVISVDPAHWAEDQATDSKHSLLERSSGGLSMAKDSVLKSDNMFGCDVCFRKFKRKRELVRHSSIHTGYRPFECSICGKAFARSDKLKRHILIHTKKKNKDVKSKNVKAKCSVCCKVLSSKQELARHVLTHSALKPYQCSQCQSSFCRRDKLIKHIKLSHGNTLHMGMSSYISN